MNRTDVGIECCYKDGWKKCVSERIKQLDKWEKQQGYSYKEGPNESMCERNESRVIDLVCRYDSCGKVYESKGGLAQHQKRFNGPYEERVRFLVVYLFTKYL